MTRVPPIPAALLDEDVRVSVPRGGDYAGEYMEPVAVGPVRIERTFARKTTEWSSDGAEATMYMDAANTAGAFDIPVGSLVSTGARTYSVASCSPFSVGGAVHHWEVGLR